ncbi:MAG: IS1595 family transposase, partial [Rhodanobacteraceae bacterium]|nr:IS1595 family transposase [Rhodanobacteraceae bacterium]
MGHGDEQGAVPGGSVVAGVHGEVWFEAQCRKSLFSARCPKVFRCPACAGSAHSTFKRDGQIYYQCTDCRHQDHLARRHDVPKPPSCRSPSEFLALHLVTSAKTNLSALELKRQLGVCYRTAWRLKHKVMHAMTEREESRKLNGLVQIDDAYLGVSAPAARLGRGSENKQAFLVAVETDTDLERPRCAVIEPVRAFSNDSISDLGRAPIAAKRR